MARQGAIEGRHWRTFPFVLLAWAVLSAPAQAQPRTDVVTLGNGDRVTGEIIGLNRGQLEFKTDDIGTIYFEWDNVATVQANRDFEVGMSDGRRFLGTLGAATARSIVVNEATGPVSLPMQDVTLINPIGKSFWRKLDGSIDIGFSYTKSSDIAQLNLNAGTLYRQPSSEVRVSLSGTLTQSSDDSEADDRATLQASYVRYRGPTLVIAAGGGFETNESLGLKLRSQIGVAAGPRLVNTNRAQLWFGGGVSVNNEQGVDTESTQNIEGIGVFRTSFYSYDQPKTNVDVSFQYYPSLSDWGRQRIQLDAAFKREVWKDVFFSVNLFDTFDSRPPDPAADKNDVGVVLSFGWSY